MDARQKWTSLVSKGTSLAKEGLDYVNKQITESIGTTGVKVPAGLSGGDGPHDDAAVRSASGLSPFEFPPSEFSRDFAAAGSDITSYSGLPVYYTFQPTVCLLCLDDEDGGMISVGTNGSTSPFDSSAGGGDSSNNIVGVAGSAEQGAPPAVATSSPPVANVFFLPVNVPTSRVTLSVVKFFLPTELRRSSQALWFRFMTDIDGSPFDHVWIDMEHDDDYVPLYRGEIHLKIMRIPVVLNESLSSSPIDGMWNGIVRMDENNEQHAIMRGAAFKTVSSSPGMTSSGSAGGAGIFRQTSCPVGENVESGPPPASSGFRQHHNPHPARSAGEQSSVSSGDATAPDRGAPADVEAVSASDMAGRKCRAERRRKSRKGGNRTSVSPSGGSGGNGSRRSRGSTREGIGESSFVGSVGSGAVPPPPPPDDVRPEWHQNNNNRLHHHHHHQRSVSSSSASSAKNTATGHSPHLRGTGTATGHSPHLRGTGTATGHSPHLRGTGTALPGGDLLSGMDIHDDGSSNRDMMRQMAAPPSFRVQGGGAAFPDALPSREELVRRREAVNSRKIQQTIIEHNDRREKEEEYRRAKLEASETMKELLDKWAHNIDGSYKDVRALLSTLEDVLWRDHDWTPSPLSVLMVNAAEVKKCYRQALLMCHPDKHQKASPEQQYRADRIFQALNESFKQSPSPS